MLNMINLESLYDKLKSEITCNSPQLPKLKLKNNYIKDSLVLLYLYFNINKEVSKKNLTDFIKSYYPDVNDVQQARHLSKQKGWWILSGTRGENISKNCYKLISVKEKHPDFKFHRKENIKFNDWKEVKNHYHNRCITCGSEDGKPNLQNKETITKLQKGHKNPKLDLTLDNIIPQCQCCNLSYKDKFIFDNNGRIIKSTKELNIENILNEKINSDEKIQKINKLLKS